MPDQTRSAATLAAGFVLLCAIFLYWGWSPEISSFGGDSAGYMLAAQYYSPYQPTSPVIEEYSNNIIYPPLFPWLLAILTGGTNILAAHLMVIGFLLAALFTLYHWIRAESFSPHLAAGITLLFAAMPSTRLISLSIWTENIYLFFSLLSLYAISQTRRNSPGKFWWMAVAAVALSTMVRVAALPLLAAFAAYLVIKRPRHWMWISLSASFPMVLWSILGSRGQTGVAGYLDVWKDRYTADSMSFLWNKIIEQFQLLHQSWVSGWLTGSQSESFILIVQIFGLLCIIGWLIRLKRLHFDAIYVLLYLIVVLAWHSSGEVLRYAYVLYPILITYGFVCLRQVIEYARASPNIRNFTPSVVCTLLIVILTPPLIIDAQRFKAELPEDVRNVRQTEFWYSRDDRLKALYNIYGQARLFEHFKTIRELVPESECIFTIKPAIVTYYTGRSSYVPPRASISEQEFQAGLNRCRYIYSVGFTSLSYPVPLYPLDRLGERAEVIAVIRHPMADNAPPVGVLARIF